MRHKQKLLANLYLNANENFLKLFYSKNIRLYIIKQLRKALQLIKPTFSLQIISHGSENN